MKIFQGDTFLKIWKVKTSDGQSYTFKNGDIIKYCLYKNINNPILNKTISISEEQDNVEIIYTSEETKNIDGGDYSLEIELTYDTNKVQTFKYELIVEEDAIK